MRRTVDALFQHESIPQVGLAGRAEVRAVEVAVGAVVGVERREDRAGDAARALEEERLVGEAVVPELAVFVVPPREYTVCLEQRERVSAAARHLQQEGGGTHGASRATGGRGAPGKDGGSMPWGRSSAHLQQQLAADEQLARLEGHAEAVTCLALDGNFLLSGAEDGVVRVWDLHSYMSIAALEIHAAPVEDMLIVPDNGLLITCSTDSTVRVLSIDVPTAAVSLEPPRSTLISCQSSLSRVSGWTAARDSGAAKPEAQARHAASRQSRRSAMACCWQEESDVLLERVRRRGERSPELEQISRRGSALPRARVAPRGPAAQCSNHAVAPAMGVHAAA